MKLIATRPCNFGGKRFYIGDEIPSELVLDPAAQEKMGVLVRTDAQGHPAPTLEQKENVENTIEILIPVEEGDLALDVSKEGIREVFTVLTGKPADAETIIEQMTDGDALILLHMADSRKAIKAAAEARAKEISQEEAGEQ